MPLSEQSHSHAHQHLQNCSLGEEYFKTYLLQGENHLPPSFLLHVYFASVNHKHMIKALQTSVELRGKTDLFCSASLKMVFLMKLMSLLETETQMDELSI